MTANLTRAKIETELHVIAAMLLDNRTIAGITEILEHQDFTNKDVGTIFKTIVTQWQEGATVTPSSVCADMNEAMTDLAWDAYNSIGSAVDAVWYAQKVKDAATRRELAARARQITKEAETVQGEVSEIIGKAQGSIFDIQHKEVKTTIAEDFAEVQRESREAAKSKYGTLGVPTGFDTYDDITGGLRKQDMIVIAARPSVGKTAIAVNWFQNIIEKTDDFKALFFSGEMSRRALLLRMASGMSRIDNNALARGNLSKESWKKYKDTCDHLVERMEGRAWIDDKSRPSPGHVRAITKQRMQSDGVDVVFIDYFNIMSLSGKFAGRYEKLTEISGGIKALAKDLNIPVVLLAQIGRGAESRDEMIEPGLGDLKETGALEQDADIVVFPHRSNRMATQGKLIIAKQRNGPLGVVPMEFEPELTLFKEKK